MNLVASAPTWVLVILTVLLVAAAVEDAVRLRISNATPVAVLVLALVTMAIAGFPATLWQNAVVFAFFLIGGTFIFATGQMGGGDVKLLAALGAWVNLMGALSLLASVFLTGGILALGYIIFRRISGRRSAKESKAGIPYGVAIVAGALFAFAMQLGVF